jgi:hypothetical protein
LNDVSGEPFMLLFINIISIDSSSKRFDSFKKKHKNLIYKTFGLMKKHHYDLIKENGWIRELDLAVKKWNL